MKTLVVVLSLLLAGCFLTPQGNNSPQVKKPLIGDVQMMDIQGAIVNQVEGLESFVLARFVKQSSSITGRFHVARNVANAREGLSCDVARQPVSQQNATQEYTSVGAVEFDRQNLTENAIHQYVVKIARDYPPGIFEIKAAGSAESDGFKDLISMPEAIRGAKVNGTDIEVTGVVTDKLTPLKYEWSRPARLEEANWVLVVVSSVGETEAVELNCYIREKELWATQGTTLSIEVPAQYYNQVPGSDDVEFYIERMHQYAGQSPAIVDNTLSGVRVVATKGIIKK